MTERWRKAAPEGRALVLEFLRARRAAALEATMRSVTRIGPCTCGRAECPQTQERLEAAALKISAELENALDGAIEALGG